MELIFFHKILIFIIGFIVSAFGAIVGFGGGVFIVPVLVLLFNVPIHFAIGSVIFSLFPSALISTIYNYRLRLIDFAVGILWEIPATLGIVIGAIFTTRLPAFHLKLTFSAVVIVIGAGLFTRNLDNQGNNSVINGKFNNLPLRLIRTNSHGSYSLSGISLTGFGMMTGVMAGLLGVGGGFLKTPILVTVFRIPARVAAATALFTIVTTSITGSVTHFFLGHLQWDLALLLAVSFSSGAILGNRIVIGVSEKKLVKLIAAGLVFAGLAMLLFSLK
jgi:uncharacterized membrane protein YfcA